MRKELSSLKQYVKNYLDNRAKTDELFAKAYAKPNKNIDECTEYIAGEARKMGNIVGVSDEVVYGWAVHYYDEDNIKIDKLPSGTRASVEANMELTEEDKQKAYDQAIQEYKQQCLAEIKAKEEAKAKKEKEKRAALIAKRKEEAKSIPTLFDFV